VTQVEEAAYDKVDGRWKAALKCGKFTSPVKYAFDAVFTTPSGEKVTATEYRDGHYIHYIDRLESGEYTCNIPAPALPSECAPLQFTASVILDMTEARLDVLEAQQAETYAKIAEIEAAQKEAEEEKEEDTQADGDLTALQDEVKYQNTKTTYLLQKAQELMVAQELQGENVADLEAKVMQLQNTTILLAGKTDALNATLVKMDVRVAFFARGLVNFSPKKGETLVFPDVQVNDGDGYNGTTGVFTAPVTGVYMLTCMMQGHGDAEDNFQVEMLVDGMRKVDIFKDGAMSDEDQNSTIEVATRLVKGQKVWLRTMHKETAFDSNPKWANGNAFSGALLKADL